MMNGVDMAGRKIRVARPKDYRPAPTELQQFIVHYAPGAFRPPVVQCLGVIDP